LGGSDEYVVVDFVFVLVPEVPVGCDDDGPPEMGEEIVGVADSGETDSLSDSDGGCFGAGGGGRFGAGAGAGAGTGTGAAFLGGFTTGRSCVGGEGGGEAGFGRLAAGFGAGRCWWGSGAGW
jgi:hypothetical protein